MVEREEVDDVNLYRRERVSLHEVVCVSIIVIFSSMKYLLSIFRFSFSFKSINGNDP